MERKVETSQSENNMSATKCMDKKTQTDQVRSKVISVCLFILKNGEFDDVAYKVIKQKRSEESVVITFNRLFGVLGENVDPLSISLSCHGICKVLILFRSIQTYNLVNNGSFDAGLFLNILRRYQRNTVFCPGVPKSYFQSRKTKFKSRLAYLENPFPRCQATGCTIYHDRPETVKNLLLQCKACSFVMKEVSMVVRNDTSKPISQSVQADSVKQELDIPVTITEECAKYCDSGKEKSEYSCLKKLLKRNTNTYLIEADVIDQDLDGSATVGLRLPTTVGKGLQKDCLNAKPSSKESPLKEEHSVVSESVEAASVIRSDGPTCGVLSLSHINIGNDITETFASTSKEWKHDIDENDTVNNYPEVTSTVCRKVPGVSLRSEPDFVTSGTDTKSVKSTKIAECMKYPKAVPNYCLCDRNDVLSSTGHVQLSESDHCMDVTVQDSNNMKSPSEMNDLNGLNRTKNAPFRVHNTSQNRARNYSSYSSEVLGSSDAEKHPSDEISSTRKHMANKLATEINEITFKQVTTSTEASSASERLDDIISQLKKSVLKPQVTDLPPQSNAKQESSFPTHVSKSVATETIQVLHLESPLVIRRNEDIRKRKRTPSKKVLENLEILHKYKIRNIDTLVAKKKATYESHAGVVSGFGLSGKVKKIRSQKLKKTLSKVTVDRVSVRSDCRNSPLQKSCSKSEVEVTDNKNFSGMKRDQHLLQEKFDVNKIFDKGKRIPPEIPNIIVDNANGKATHPERKTNIPLHDPAETQHTEDLEIYVESLMQLANQPTVIVTEGQEQKMKRNGDPAQCPICFEFYSSDRTLKRHMRIHNLVRPYTCPVCNKSFVQKITMKVHMRLHSGEKPHQCFICGRSFAQKSNMETHVRRHLGVRPYKCDLCSKGFSDKGSLGEHMKTHTGEQPYLCTICGKSFSQRANMRTHLSRHQAEKSYVCTECDKSFKNKDSFMKHKRNHHTDSDPSHKDM